MRVLVIGVGTRQGDDAAGLAVAERLARSPLPSNTSVITCERPLDLVELLDGAEAVVVVDALRSGAEPGSLRWLRETDLAAADGLSSHGLGVAEAIALARALGRAPVHLELVGIGAGEPEARVGSRMRPAVERAAAEAAQRIRARAEVLAATDAPGRPGPPARRGPHPA